MTIYVLRRIGLFVIGLIVTTVVVFVALRVLPGDVAQVIGGTRATPEQLAHIRVRYGLDQPLLLQYFDWVGGLFRLDLGHSLITNDSIQHQVVEKLAATLPLCLLAMLIAVLIGVPLGVFAALQHTTTIGRAVGYLAQAAAAVPVLWTGLLLILLFGRGVGLLPLLPSQGFPRDGWGSPAAALLAIVLPALTIGLFEGAVILRYTRSAVLDAMQQDYVRTAMARGYTRTQAVVRHGVPNASLAVLSVIGLEAASLIGGTVVIESLFSLPGLGTKLVTDVGTRDLVSVQGTVLVLTAIVLFVGLAIDLAHRIIDPRQRRVTT